MQEHESPREYVKRMAGIAARAAPPGPENIASGTAKVISADGILLGKPGGSSEAVGMLRILAGRKHNVLTAECRIGSTGSHTKVDETKVQLLEHYCRELGITAAETGHLVFGTLHTASAGKTVDRIVDVFPAQEQGAARAMLSESLQAVISQTLLKRIGGGRVAAHEIMIGTPAIRNLIREGKVAQMYSAMQTGGAAGMQTLDNCLRDLVAGGVIEPEIARAQARTPGEFC